MTKQPDKKGYSRSLILSLLLNHAIALDSEIKQMFQETDKKINDLSANGNTVIVIEAKTHFQPKHVGKFLKSLPSFTTFFPEYAGYQVYGAVAGLRIDKDVIKHAYRKGLFVVAVKGQMTEIKNDEVFTPKNFSGVSLA